MQAFPNEISRRHTPRPPQLQFPDIAHTEVGSSDAYDQSNFGVPGPLLDRHLYENDEQSPLADPYQNGDYGPQSSTSDSIDGTQGYWPWRTPLPQTGGHFGSFEGTFQQQSDYIEAPSATNTTDARHHMVPPCSLTALCPEIGINEVARARRNSQYVDSRPSAIQMSTSNCQIDQQETITTGYPNPSLFSFDRLSGDGRSLATTRAHINPNVSDPWHNGQSPNQGSSERPLASPSLDQTQRIHRGRSGSLAFAQDRSMMPYVMEPLSDHDFAQNAHGAPQGYTRMHLSPDWRPAREDSPKLQYVEASKVSDYKVRQSRRMTTRGSKKKRRSDSSSPTTPPTTTKRVRRKYSPAERAEVNLKRKTGACQDCRSAKRKVCESLQISLSRCHQADCSCSARIRHLGMALPHDISLCRENPLPDPRLQELHLAGLKNERRKPIYGVEFSMVDTGVWPRYNKLLPGPLLSEDGSKSVLKFLDFLFCRCTMLCTLSNNNDIFWLGRP